MNFWSEAEIADFFYNWTPKNMPDRQKCVGFLNKKKYKITPPYYAEATKWYTLQVSWHFLLNKWLSQTNRKKLLRKITLQYMTSFLGWCHWSDGQTTPRCAGNRAGQAVGHLDGQPPAGLTHPLNLAHRGRTAMIFTEPQFVWMEQKRSVKKHWKNIC